MSCWDHSDDTASALEPINCAAISHNSSILLHVSCAYGVYHHHVASVVSAIGVLCNMAIIIVLLRRNMRKSSVNVILTVIALCDMLLMASNLLYLRVDNCDLMAFSYWWQQYTLLYANLSVCSHAISLCLTVLMAALRYVIIKSQGHSSMIDSYRVALGGAVACTLGVLAGCSLNIVRYEVTYVKDMSMPILALCPHMSELDQVNMSVYLLDDREWFMSICSLESMNFWLTGVLFKVLPCILLTVFMSLLVQQLLQARTRTQRLKGTAGNNSKGDRTTIMLVSIVAIFLVTELPQGALMIAAGITPKANYLYTLFGDWLDLFSLINSSVNFVLYVAMSAQFRDEFAQVFGICRWINRCDWCRREVNDLTNTAIVTKTVPDMNAGGNMNNKQTLLTTIHDHNHCAEAEHLL